MNNYYDEEFDYPPVTRLGERHVKHAVFEHQCNNGHVIPVGDGYDQLKVIYDGQFTVVNYCLKCQAGGFPDDDTVRDDDDLVAGSLDN